MTLADRLNHIIREQNVSKAQFARRVGISENYIYILTGQRGSSTEKPMGLSGSLCKLIALEFGYNEEWILYGTGKMRPE